VRLAFLGIVVSTAFVACTKPPAADDEAARKAGIALMEAVKNAVEGLDAEKFIDLCLNSPEFVVFSDGKGLSYDEFVKSERKALALFKKFQIRWDTLAVKVLAADAVAAYGSFHQVHTYKEGGVAAFTGDVTWIAVRRNGEWKLLYAHAWHFPDSTAK